ncbi:hypothetical protein LZ31DRAFT_240945 [Colletotrichum somersetense]|nr:hypothetical protein LZ31DRAFT_240945 [Colletotrichum somersetense]
MEPGSLYGYGAACVLLRSNPASSQCADTSLDCSASHGAAASKVAILALLSRGVDTTITRRDSRLAPIKAGAPVAET